MTTNRQKIKHLIVDSGPFIKLTDVRSLAENVYTVPEVVSELRDQHARDFFKQISFDIKLKRPSDSALREVMNFSKKTGDFANLSVVDFKVLALTYMIESETNGADNLHSVTDASKSNNNDSVMNNQQFNDNDKNNRDLSIDIQEEETIGVACTTIDYSMQNVLLQMGLNLISVEGKRIKQIKNWVLRCHACYKITTNMEKKFCPKCGGPTLIRTSTSTDANGNVKYYLKKNFQYKLRGTKYSIPNPKGGRNPNNPILYDVFN
ncbi:15448_t:CDS:2 [Entrophospora sp. SA101]|nr:11368_t:CDS:2 [Entrophospora sp. SA101]CAJ0632309.1 5726_t:CDS:2 [Entrophospora sp. SA101]CAJ0762010.1 15448_t:CDS:2 [Entrophospora sp. SA101]CAJ0836246.1 6657_t:CDS:2 [Entrophospora sp. SA101]